ncbi:hypothetical protein CVT26_005047 [Gymnopilus dilepis]|uniref:Uncharacterized protein n=1 Tax=Gymnopilus dilepis TaxID=231916 RepID=A0A409Y016_9AGAR|nr:hypothetical protein CVT26_005047 [Gymnopilus dilepis]
MPSAFAWPPSFLLARTFVVPASLFSPNDEERSAVLRDQKAVVSNPGFPNSNTLPDEFATILRMHDERTSWFKAGKQGCLIIDGASYPGQLRSSLPDRYAKKSPNADENAPWLNVGDQDCARGEFGVVTAPACADSPYRPQLEACMLSTFESLIIARRFACLRKLGDYMRIGGSLECTFQCQVRLNFLFLFRCPVLHPSCGLYIRPEPLAFILDPKLLS